MRRRWYALAALALVAGLAWWLRRERPAPTAEVASPTGPAPRAGGSVRAASDGRPVALAGQVVSTADGAPLPGALVAVSRLGLDFGARVRPGEPGEPPVVVAGEDGRFALDGLPAGRYSVSASASGHRPATIDGVALAAGGARRDLILRLPPGGSRLEGTVGDIGGGPVEGALVRALATREISIGAFFRAPFSTRSGADGRYALDLDDGVYVVQVTHADYVRADARVELRGPRRRDFTLTPGAAIEGVVVRAPDGQPVPGAMVTPLPADRGRGMVLSGVAWGGAISGPDGRFALRGLRPGAISLRAMAPGLASAEAVTVELGVAEQETDVVLTIGRAASIRGRVVREEDGKPIAGALAAAYRISPPTAYAASEPTDDDGAFAIHGVAPGSYSIGAGIDRRVPSPMAHALTITDADFDDLVIELDAGATLRGRVEPAAAAGLLLAVDGDLGFGNLLGAASAALVSGRTDERGGFELVGAPRGRFVLHAEADDGRAGELAVDIAGDREGLVIALEPRGEVAGQVVDEDGRPVANVTIELDPADADGARRGPIRFSPPGQVTTGDDGRFRAIGLSAGVHEVSVRDGAPLRWAGKSGEAAQKPIEVAVKVEVPIRDLRLTVEAREETVRGAVVGPDGAPAVDAWVTARYAPKGEGERRGGRGTPVLSGEGGRFEITGLRRGTYDLRAELPGGGRGTLEGVASGSSVTIKLEGHSTITGKVSRAGAPVPAFRVAVDGPTDRGETFANAEGRYRIARLSPGEYRVTVTSTDGRASGKTTVAADGEATLDLALVAYGGVRGVVVGADGKPLVDHPVWAMTDGGDDTGDRALAAVAGNGPRTDAAGRFHIGQLGAGKGSIYVFAQGSFERLATREFELAVGQDLDVGAIEVGTATAP